jgi:hypothetical protein
MYPESLFRPEALAHHRRARTAEAPQPLPLAGGRITAAYRGIGALLLLLVGAGCLLPVGVHLEGRFTARRTGGHRWQVTAAFPWRYRGALTPGTALELRDAAGCLDVVTTIVAIDERAAGLEPLVSVHGEVDGGCAGAERAGAAQARIATTPLIGVFFPALRTPLARLREAL